MQISSLTFLVAAFLVNLSLGSPIATRRLEARQDPQLESDCSKYKFKPVGEIKEDKRLDRLCPIFCEAIKKNPNSPSSKQFEQKLRIQCAVPPPPPTA
ncbi:uncharacterized protein DFL_007170 [Arthrobotrys flagrans]|uniref:Uncharacterized protein n=1 Tax=Arthrobotrys flagrans TaxID=97331 RepID=A0A436ZVG9_ARTFL|nr:hypothetical protein DFL_007170 [Arthrobotrys flagrans]